MSEVLSRWGSFLGRSKKYRVAKLQSAIRKPQDAWVTVHNVKSYNDGGILDPDDHLNDVVDDREQIIAVYEEQISPYPAHNAGDGTSASSVGTESPDIFRCSDLNHNGTKDSYVDVEISGDRLPLGVAPLQVRRGSEPTLNRLSPVCPEPDPTKRWSAAVVVDDLSLPPKQYEHALDGDSSFPCGERGEGSGEEKRGTLTRIARGSGRLSILGNNANMLRWAEAADRQLFKVEDARKEPLGGTGTSPEVSAEDRDTVIILKNEAGPLGIHVVPRPGSGGRDMGLVIQGIEPGGRIHRDGRIQVGDTVVEVNGQSLLHVSFEEAQKVFKNALRSPELALRLSGSPAPQDNPPAVQESPKRLMLPKPIDGGDTVNGLVEGEERAGLHSKVATVTPTKKVPQTTPRPTGLNVANTRKLGRRVPIKLVKGPEGLGFSVTTRDNPAGGNCPIYIKNILPHGAAIDDGRLRPGDRLLQVNGVEMTGKSQTDAVAILRNAPTGSTVDLVVSRQELEPTPSLPREMPSEKAEEEVGIFPWRNKEVLTFDIPLNDTGSAGLGVSVKGKTSTGPNGPVDLGIFVKSVIHGGAASKDRRLRTNDQLLDVNGISLLGRTNTQAMETLRRAMTQAEGPNPNAITLTVARRVPSQDTAENVSFEEGFLSSGDSCSMHLRSDSIVSSDSSAAASSSCENLSLPGSRTPDHSTSGNSENTVVYVPKQGHDYNYGRNPVLDRLMGQGPGSLPNESYLQASHESWSAVPPPGGSLYGRRRPPPFSPNSSANSGEAVLIDEDYPSIARVDVPPMTPVQEEPPAMDGNNLNISDLSLADGGNFCRDGFGRQSISEKRHAQLDARNTDTYKRNKKSREAAKQTQVKVPHTSPAALVNAENDKRTATKEVSNLVRSSSADSLLSHSKCGGPPAPPCSYLVKSHQLSKVHRTPLFFYPACCFLANGDSPGTDSSCVTTNTTVTKSNNSSGAHSSVTTQHQQLGPALGMRKSSSLESLQTMVQETHKGPENGNPAGRGSRGCNESFRAAVDRSYEGPTCIACAPELMETLEEEKESESGGSSGGIDHRIPCPVHSNTDDQQEKKGVKGQQRKKGLLKGLGSVFSRFGKNRKTIPEPGSKMSREELEAEQARRAAQDEQGRIQEQYRRLIEQQNTQQAQRQNPQQTSSTGTSANNNNNNNQSTTPSRQERMQQLRAQHQKRHVERQCHYPRDDLEEWYEQDLQKKMHSSQTPQCRPLPPVPQPITYATYGYSRRVLPKVCSPQRNGSFGRSFSLRTPRSIQRRESDIAHSRSQSFDIFKEMERPGSRVGLADPNQYSHYVNFNEIQMHLRQFQQKQPPIPSRPDRPASNYYEYESIQPMKHHKEANGMRAGGGDSGSLPRHAHVAGHRMVYAKVASSSTQFSGSSPLKMTPTAAPRKQQPMNLGYRNSPNSQLYARREGGQQMPGSKV
ncbi:partitioning defective 3 homolog isoform X3 [Ornithodoros turicata]|uniref:partitioning defective 3 homolog isoform X3 n=1 Tax=Ornithodoros turicata TaxID=34597 RepID=UPI0031388802